MEVLLHHYAFGKPTHKYVAPAPAAPPEAELMSRMTIEDQRETNELWTKMREIQLADITCGESDDRRSEKSQRCIEAARRPAPRSFGAAQGGERAGDD
jgi:hypothetical protein